ncbi:pilus assembly protein PilM [bacterium]|nr:pilus assembly protein PilM [bacterium]
MPLPKGRAPVLGLEIARGGLRYVELQNVGGVPTCLSYGEIAFGSSEELGTVLRFLVEDDGIRARDVHVVDSTSRANLKIQTVPEMPDADLDAVARGEIAAEAELLGAPLVGDWCPLRRRDGQVEILVGKAPEADRAALDAACREAGLRLQAMATSSIVLANHFVVSGEVPEGQMIGLLDIGRAKMNMALLSQEHVLLAREVYQGLTASFLAGTEEDRADLDVIGEGLDEIIGTVEQIRRTLAQYQESHPQAVLHHLVMTGETTRISQLLGLLQHDLQVPVRTYDPAVGLDESLLPAGLSAQAPTYAVPWVLAQTPAAAFPLNFAEGVPDLRPVRAVQAIAVAAVLGAVALGIADVRAASQLGSAQAARAELEGEKLSLESELGLIDAVRDRWNGWVKEQTSSLGLPGADLRGYLAVVTSAMPGTVRLLRTEFSREGPRWSVEVDGLAFSSGPRGSHEALDGFVRALAQSPLVAEVKLLPVAYENRGQMRWPDEVNFRLVLDLRAIEPAPEMLP